MPGQPSTLLTSGRVVARISAIILIAEFFIMQLLGALPVPLDSDWATLLDVALLATVATPAIYLWVIRPFVVARDEALAEVRALALTDPLTHLANRRLLATHLEKMINGSAHHPVLGGLLLIDLDGFKEVNDRHGHDAGDAVLVEVAKRLLAVTRGEDVAARLGGDEFVVLVHRLEMDRSTSKVHTIQLAERLIGLMQEPIEFDGKSVRIGASIGIRLLERPLADLQAPLASRVSALISEADVAMYQAKNAGRGRAVVFGD